MTVFIDPTGNPTFDWTLMVPMALAQSYNLDTTVATQNLTANDLADGATVANWTFAEPTEKSWTLTTDQLLLNEDVNGTYDPTGKAFNDDAIAALKAGTVVWVAIVDSDAVNPDVVPLYGQGIVTGYNQSGNIDEFHTYSMVVTGQGELLTDAVVPA